MRSLSFVFFAAVLQTAAGAQTPTPAARPKAARRPDAPLAPLPALPPGQGIPAPAPLARAQAEMMWELMPPPSELDFNLTRSALEFQMSHELQMMPLELHSSLDMQHAFALDHELSMAWGPDEPRGALPRLRPEQGTPEDSLYRAAREALNRGEYTRASTMFQSLEQKYPRSRVAPAALYYRAFALYRAGATDELRAAVEALKAQQERYPEASADPDAATLRTRLYAALAARGDAQAASQLRAATAGGPNCDKEDVEVRAEALNALAQISPADARPTLKKVLARRDECSVRLRRTAVYILGRNGTEEAATDLIEVAKTDPDPSVRSDAIGLLGRTSGTTTVRTLETLFNEAGDDDRMRQAALSALRSKGGPDAKRVLKTIIERSDVSDRMRAEAISQLAGSASDARIMVAEAYSGGQATTVAGRRPVVSEDNEDAAYLRGLYGKMTSPTLKSAIIGAVARMGSTANEQFLLGIVKNRDEEVRLRRDALSRLRVSSLSIEEIGKLFDALPERDLRSAVVNQLASREEPAATDKLIEIIKSGTDPQIRREAISALARKKDPRATKLLLDLVEKP